MAARTDLARRRTLLRMMIGSVVATVLCILFVDEAIARALQGSALADVGKEIIFVVDYIAMFWVHKWGSAFVLGGIAVIMAAVPQWRRHAPRMLAVVLIHIATRHLVTWLKVTTGRLRPASWLNGGAAGQTFWQAGAGFPSGHASLFASITYPIVALWPCRPWIAATAYAAPLIAGTARILQNAHFVSDVTAAIALCAGIGLATNLAASAIVRWLNNRA